MGIYILVSPITIGSHNSVPFAGGKKKLGRPGALISKRIIFSGLEEAEWAVVGPVRSLPKEVQ